MSDGQLKRILVFFGPALLLLAVVFAYPVVDLLIRSFTTAPGGFYYYREFLGSWPLVSVLVRSVVTAAVVTAVAFVVGYPYAYFCASTNSRWRQLLLGIVGVSLFISVVGRAYAWLVILERTGLINTALQDIGFKNVQLSFVYNSFGVVIGLIQYGIPFMVLPIYDVMSRVDVRLRQASAALGAGPFTTFFRVYLPLTLPGVLAGSVIVFIASTGYYVLPSLLGGAGNLMIGQMIAQDIQTNVQWGLASAVATVLLAVSLVFFGLFIRASRLRQLVGEAVR